MRPRNAVVFALALLLISGLPPGHEAGAAPGYRYFVVGNPADVTTPVGGGLMLTGGGPHRAGAR